jgi:uncharacterized protein YbcC (UPF0753/DUF2309 family)
MELEVVRIRIFPREQLNLFASHENQSEMWSKVSTRNSSVIRDSGNIIFQGRYKSFTQEIRIVKKRYLNLGYSSIRGFCSRCDDHHHPTASKPLDVTSSRSSIANMVERSADILPHQGILENFVHHNPLEHFQDMTWKQALDYVQKLEAYRSPADRAHAITQINPRERVKEALVDLSAAFLDRGAAKWAPAHRDKGFLYFFAWLENLGFAPWREDARLVAQKTLEELQKHPERKNEIAEQILLEDLKFFGIPEEDWEACIRSQLLELRGWAGMFRRMETHPSECPPNTKVELLDFAVVQSILLRSSVYTLAKDSSTWNPRKKPISEWLAQQSTLRPIDPAENHSHTSAIAYVDQVAEHREKLEKNFEKSLLYAIGSKPIPKEKTERPFFQLYTCIDDRECSLRRYIESSKPPGQIETFGLAGFFGVPIKYQPADGRDSMILAPEGQNPSAILIEDESDKLQAKVQKSRQKLFAWMNLLWEKASFSPMGSLLLTGFFPLSLSRLIAMGFLPFTKMDVKLGFAKKLLPKQKTDFQLPMPAEQAAALLARSFKDIGTQNRFSQIVLILGHGSVSLNNPFAAAYNCGACGGREGGPNARLFARLANNLEVRNYLETHHGIKIPSDTLFIGGMHNTTAEIIEFFDTEEHQLPLTHRGKFQEIEKLIERARGRNALERCERFLFANYVKTPEEALRHVQCRANDLAEVRPELNHATNAAVVVGRRDLTVGRFLDRRAFLPSYDPFSDDDQGTNLEHVLAPALGVCSGINLEYLFSTIDVEKHGAGTKVPLNIVGNIAVLQGTTGDLRPGLPTQMTEMHTPIRAFFIIDAPPQRIEAVLSRRKELQHLVVNEWVRVIARDPKTNKFYRQINGEYFPVKVEEVTNSFIPFDKHLEHAQGVKRKEDIYYHLSLAGMAGAAVLPPLLFGVENMLNPYGLMIVAGGTSLALPVLAFARRYLHGEFMFGRFAALTVGLLSGFNIVATASSLEQVLAGWSLLGFASTFLIGAYNYRPTVRNNATFIFGAYQISDLALLTAATYSMVGANGSLVHPHIAAAALLIASVYKSSQFPLTALFARSMEGPTPASALGYAGLSAHAGVVLLTSTLPLWFEYEWARIALGSLGLFTAFDATLVSKIRPERKGAIANATSATIGLIYATLALGYSDLALMMSFGHAAYRMNQILRAPNIIQDISKIKAALGAKAVESKVVPDWLYATCWRLRRYEIDFTMMWLLHKFSRPLAMPKEWKLNKFQQWGITGVGVTLAGFPFTPYYYGFEHTVMELLIDSPLLAAGLMTGYFGMSMTVIRFLFLNVLDMNRFQNIQKKIQGPNQFNEEMKLASKGRPPKQTF